jgi:hypothetical protein
MHSIKGGFLLSDALSGASALTSGDRLGGTTFFAGRATEAVLLYGIISFAEGATKLALSFAHPATAKMRTSVATKNKRCTLCFSRKINLGKSQKPSTANYKNM